MSLDVCEPAVHERMKRDSSWPKLAFVGISEAVEDLMPACEVRNCACGSTLYREIPAPAVQR